MKALKLLFVSLMVTFMSVGAFASCMEIDTEQDLQKVDSEFVLE